MVASDPSSAARLAVLQERKHLIEQSITKCNQELRQLCLQEADITGALPVEMPLEPGEIAPIIRRRVGTAYQLSENLIQQSGHNEESITDLELQIQLHANMAEAALGLANESNINKTLRRQHLNEYRQYKAQFNQLQEKLREKLETSDTVEKLQKQSKSTSSLASRDQQSDDHVSHTGSTNSGDSYNTTANSDATGSMRSHSSNTNSAITSSSHCYNHSRGHTLSIPTLNVSNSCYAELPDYASNRAFYRLSINGYNSYMRRRQPINSTCQDTNHGCHSTEGKISLHSPSSYAHHASNRLTKTPQYPIISRHPHLLVHNGFGQSYTKDMPQKLTVTTLSPSSLFTKSPSLCTSKQKIGGASYQNNCPKNVLLQSLVHSPPYNGHRNTLSVNSVDQLLSNLHQIQPHQQYGPSSMESSSTRSLNVANEHGCGLGGRWYTSEDNGKMVWCPMVEAVLQPAGAASSDTLCLTSDASNLQREKRFGSLDRRRKKRTHHLNHPLATHHHATMPHNKSHSTRTTLHKSTPVMAHNYEADRADLSSETNSPNNKGTSYLSGEHETQTVEKDDRQQLIRTLSLGSVGANSCSTADSPATTCVAQQWSTDTEKRSTLQRETKPTHFTLKSLESVSTAASTRRYKEKEWTETSLDGIAINDGTVSGRTTVTRSPSASSSILSPDDKYVTTNSNTLTPIGHPSCPSISASTNPQSHDSATLKTAPPILDSSYANILLTSALPRHCTVIQAGQCKPYHEESKPFEMSDFYKYSTKFKNRCKEQRGEDGGGDAGSNGRSVVGDGLSIASVSADVFHLPARTSVLAEWSQKNQRLATVAANEQAAPAAEHVIATRLNYEHRSLFSEHS